MICLALQDAGLNLFKPDEPQIASSGNVNNPQVGWTLWKCVTHNLEVGTSHPLPKLEWKHKAQGW
jgi:hypothetical protein